MEKKRLQKLRALVRKTNKARRDQAKKIDILCNDLVMAQKDFIKLVRKLSFVADAYEKLSGLTDLAAALNETAGFIKSALPPEVNVAVFLLDEKNFKIHIFNSNQPIAIDAERFSTAFTTQLVRNISNANSICLAEDLFAMGLQPDLPIFNKISLSAVPLAHSNLPLGFLLIYRRAEENLTRDDLEKIAAITPGLSRTIKSCQVLSHSKPS